MILVVVLIFNINNIVCPPQRLLQVYRLTNELNSLAQLIDHQVNSVNISEGSYVPLPNNLAEIQSNESSSTEHRESDDKCGISTLSTLGRNGHNRIASESEFPWQVAVSLNGDPDDTDCIGTIISDYYILTAAHCIQDVSDVSDMRITAGGSGSRFNNQIMRRVANVITHESFVSPTENYDIGLIKVVQPFDFSKGNINTACLPPPDMSPDQYVRGELFVTAFRESDDDMDESQQLIASSVPLIDERTCRSMYRTASLSRVICAGNTNSRYDTTCNGESGSPLIGRDLNGRAVILGIASWGFGCSSSGFPAVYTDVRQYVHWIIERAI